jgi:hypothetical protein
MRLETSQLISGRRHDDVPMVHLCHETQRIPESPAFVSSAILICCNTWKY